MAEHELDGRLVGSLVKVVSRTLRVFGGKADEFVQLERKLLFGATEVSSIQQEFKKCLCLIG